MIVMAEFRRYPLRIEQSKLDGWWFIFVDEVPGLGILGPNYEALLNSKYAVYHHGKRLFLPRGG
jgi:hypothetical protein